MKVLAVLILFFSQHVFALGAHVHGFASIDIASEKKQILIMFKTPGFSAFGFGHKPKTKKQKAVFNKVKKSWVQNENLFNLKGVKCKIESKKFDVKYIGSHSDVSAEMTLNCDKDVSASELQINIIKNWENIKEVHLQLLKSDGSVLSKKFKKSEYKIIL